MIDFGIVKPGTVLYIPFTSFAGSTGASASMTGLAVGDILSYKDGSTTERASTAGYTLLDTDGLDFDGKVGLNGISIDLADNTTAGFWAAGSRYWILVGDVTVDSQTVRFIAATFTIGLPQATLNTTVATLSSQTSFTLTAGPAEDNALVGCVLYIHDVASAVQGGFAVCSAYTGASKTVTLTAGTTYTVAASDNVMVMSPSNTRWAGATVQTARDLGAAIVGTLAAGTHNPQSGDAYARLGTPAGASTAADIAAAKADTAAVKVKTDYLPSVTAGGAGGLFIAGTNAATTVTTSFTTTFTGNLTGSVNTLTTLPSVPTNWLTAAGIAASAMNGKGDWNVGKTGYALSSAGVQAIWDALTSALTTVGSIGKLIVDNLNATISSRSTYAGGDTSGTTTLLSRVVGTLAAGTHNPQSGDAYARLGAPAGASAAADIAAVKSDSATLLNRLGAITGTGVNTVLGFFKALLNKAATTPSDIGGTFDPATDSTEAVRDNMGTAQTGDAYARLGASGAGLSAIPWNAAWDAEVQSEATDALNAYDPPTNTEMEARTLVAASYLTAAGANAEMLDVLATDTRAEPGQGTPPATTSIALKLDYLYKAWRNKKTQDGTDQKLYADDGTTVDQKVALTDVGGVTTIGEVATGP